MSERNVGGRPPIKNPLTKKITGRFTIEEYTRFDELAKSLKITKAELIRSYSLKGKVTNAFANDTLKTRNLLISIANNLNQLMRQAHTYGLLSVEEQANEQLSEVKSILHNYSNVRKSH